VPALATDRGIITETPAILAFIAQTYPQSELAPIDDPFEFAQVQAFNNYLCATVHVAHAHRVRGTRWADDPAAIEAMKQKVPQTMAECFSLIEEEMFQGPWVMGEKYSICDIYLFTISRWLEGDSVDINRFPNVADHAQRMLVKPSVEKILALQTV
jgi:glutathione S-transferase